MVKQIDSMFDCFEFSPDEQSLAYVFSDLNLAHIKNERAIAANKKILTKIGTMNGTEEVTTPQDLMLAHKYYEGFIEALSLLIAYHESNAYDVREKARQDAEEALQRSNPDLNTSD